MGDAAAGRWIRSPLWDWAFLSCALWLAPAVAVLALLQGSEGGPLPALALVLTIALWIGHRLSSAYLAYCTSGYRPLLRSQPLRFVVLPAVTLVAVFAFVLPGDAAMPWSRADRIALLLVIDYVLNAYHFAAQHYGVLALYRSCAALAADPRARTADRLFALGIGGAVVVGAEILAGTSTLPDGWLGLGGSALTTPVRAAGSLLVAAACVATALRVPSMPRTLYVGGVGVLVLTALWLHPYVFLLLWTVQHWTASIGLTSLAAHAAPEPGPSRWYRFWHVVGRRPAGTWLALVVAGALLFPLLDIEASGVAGRDAGPWTSVRDALASSPWVPVLVAIGFASGFLHYQLDRAVYRFAHPDVRRAAAGLLGPARRA